MRRVLSNHSEVARAWAKQSQPEGRAGNMSFDGPVIYSYHWWPMAKLETDGVALFRQERYSQSTCKHQLLVLRALKYQGFFSVVDLDGNHFANVAHYVFHARRAAESFWNCRTGEAGMLACWQRWVEEGRRYAKRYNCENLLPNLFGYELLGPKANAKLNNRVA